MLTCDPYFETYRRRILVLKQFDIRLKHIESVSAVQVEDSPEVAGELRRGDTQGDIR
jgi:hypothetical protein